jgi:hypothetical protein
MGLSRWHRAIAILALLFAVVYAWKRLFEAPRSPCYSIDVKHFGATVGDVDDVSIHAFRIPFEQSQVDDVVQRLNRTRFSEPQIIVDHQSVNRSTYGFNRHTAETVRDYFLQSFDWQTTVNELNVFRHYRTNIAVRHVARLVSIGLHDNGRLCSSRAYGFISFA